MELFLTIAFVHFIALLTPGTDFFLILKTLIQSDQKSTNFICIGIALGNFLILVGIYLSLFFAGKMNVQFLTYLKWAGTLYLIYLAYQCFKAVYSTSDISIQSKPSHHSLNQIQYLNNLFLGLGSSLLNPKNLMFYTTLVILIYPKFSFIQNLLVSIWMVAVVLIWNLTIVKLLSFQAYILCLKRYIKYLYFLSGLSFSVFAIILVGSS